MSDILTRLAGLTRKEDIERIAKDYAERFGMPHKAGPGFRLAHEEDMAKGIKAAIYESNAAIIALVQEAVGEIEGLRTALTQATDFAAHVLRAGTVEVNPSLGPWIAKWKEALNPQEAAPC
jgi:hypothetical protein